MCILSEYSDSSKYSTYSRFTTILQMESLSLFIVSLRLKIIFDDQGVGVMKFAATPGQLLEKYLDDHKQTSRVNFGR